MLLLELLLGLIRFLLGAALFSFMNVVAWRLPRGMDPLKGRSCCLSFCWDSFVFCWARRCSAL